MTDPEAFYDQLADVYGDCTSVQNKLQVALEFGQSLKDRYQPQRVLDAACGTGLYALAMAGLGLSVTGADLSAGQIRQARRAARQQGLSIDWHVCSFETLPQCAPGPFDLVTCLGNSIVHLLTDADLQASLKALASVLVPGGHLVLSLLNYRKILDSQERIVGLTSQGQESFVRFYDFLHDQQLRFNVMRVRHGSDPKARILSTRIRGLTDKTLQHALGNALFESPECFGGLDLEPFEPETSDLLVLVARKSP